MVKKILGDREYKKERVYSNYHHGCSISMMSMSMSMSRFVVSLRNELRLDLDLDSGGSPMSKLRFLLGRGPRSERLCLAAWLLAHGNLPLRCPLMPVYGLQIARAAIRTLSGIRNNDDSSSIG